MAVAFGHVQSINRRSGRSAVAVSAYRAGCRLIDTRTGRVCDYRRKRGIQHSEITVPEGCEWAADRQRLWDAAEAAERRGDATIAREWLGALPHEVSEAGRIEICREYAAWLSERHGVAVDWNIHAPDARPITGDGEGRNWHVHALLTSRRVTYAGMSEKTRELDTKGTASEHIEAWRRQWQEIVNRRLEAEQTDSRIDMRSYARQGQSRIGAPKIGAAASAIERRGGKSDAGNRVRAVAQINRRRRAEGRRLVQEYKQLQEEIMRLSQFNRPEHKENPWKGQKVPYVGHVEPVRDNRPRKKKKELTPEERQKWKGDRLSDHYDSDLHHLAESIRQVQIRDGKASVQLQDYTWIRDVGDYIYYNGEITDDGIRAKTDIVQAKGWNPVNIYGSEEYKARSWIEYQMRGIEVANYDPPEHIKRRVAELMAGHDEPAEPSAPDWMEILHDEADDTPRPAPVPDPEVVPSLRAPGI